jgi:integrase
VRVRVKDVDFAQHILLVRDGKGEKDRITMLPESLVAPLQEHLVRVKQLHTKDLAEGYGAVYLPYALERKYPNANREWGWQYVFPAKSRSVDPRTGPNAAITWMKAVCRKRYAPRRAWPGSPNTSPAIPFGTRSPRSCWKPATIFGPCRNCSGIET